ncbi:hypothetical protein JTE90_008489 [Oedothorax gibbosus]|uniref:Uncharacterized protein n=1 Tax=Oedothorax gibbosus TaxID=931172 RepID=A0AAV6UZ68_9ARAC|nr:hypothetical protein JTE90_008489 [Oedothorax gibbosus]
MPGLDCSSYALEDRVKDLLVASSKKRSFRSHQQLLQQPLYSCDFKVGNPEGCLGKLIEGDNKDNTHWGDPDGPGKK